MTKEEKAQMAIVEDYISMLLAKKSIFDRDWVEIDDLDSPLQENATIRQTSKVPFEIMRIVNGDIQLGGLFITSAEQYMLYDNLTSRKRWIKTKRIRQLLHDSVRHTKVKDTVNGYCLLAYLDRQMLLDNAEPERCPH